MYKRKLTSPESDANIIRCRRTLDCARSLASPSASSSGQTERHNPLPDRAPRMVTKPISSQRAYTCTSLPFAAFVLLLLLQTFAPSALVDELSVIRPAHAQKLVINPNQLYCPQAEKNACLTVIRANRNPKQYERGQPTLAYVRFLYSNSTTYDNGTETKSWLSETAMFYPNVDEYTSLQVPNTYQRLVTYAEILVTVDFVFGGNLYQSLTPLGWAKNQKVVPFRTVIITMTNGTPTSIAWEQTKCYYSDCDCVDNMCPEKCTDTAGCDLKVYVGWAGTDVAGNILNSASYSIYKFQNVI